MKRFLAALGGILLVALLIAGWLFWGPSAVPEGQPPLITLSPENFSQLRADFNEASGTVRVVALLSPT